MYVSPAETVDTVSVDTSQLRGRTGQRRRRGDHGHHQVGHEQLQRLRVRVLQQRQAERAAVLPGAPRRRRRRAHHRRDARRARQEEPAVLLRVVGRAVSAHQQRRLLQRAARGAAQRRLQPGVQRERHAAGHLRPDDGQSRRDRTACRSRATSFPQDRIDEIARQIQDLYPTPNAAGTAGANVGGVNVSRNFTREQRRTFDRNNYDGKVNWNRTSANQIWGKYSRMNADVSNLWKLGLRGRRRRQHGRAAGHVRHHLDAQPDDGG